MQLDEWHMFWVSPLNEENLKLLAIDAPHQSFLSTGSEVPFDKKSSFPPGEAKRKKP